MTERVVRALNESTWSGFAELCETSGGFPSGCWCMGFHPEGVWKDTTVALNRERKLDRVREGTTHAALVFEGDTCIGWCQFGSPEELPRIKNRAAYENSVTTLPDWRIACCYVAKGHRRQGAALDALAGALNLIAGLGGGVVEGYPEPAGDVLLDSCTTVPFQRTNSWGSPRTPDRQTPLGRHQGCRRRRPRSLGATGRATPVVAGWSPLGLVAGLEWLRLSISVVWMCKMLSMR